jgi:LAO/AO transport system kinase
VTTPPLADRVLTGDPRALARAITLIEDESPDAAPLVAALHPHAGRAIIVGITGPPGAGKSTLVDRLAALLRARGKTVGVLAVDPSSPFSGGAILGDRVRMQGHAGDPGVFIRSMATRGHLGGLSRATSDAATVLDAAGKDYVVIETVGVGQDEVDIVRTADVCVVVLVPGTGDDVQALKAGIMEIADVFVVNKADREGADRMVTAIESVLGLQPAATGWTAPVLKTEATADVGTASLLDSIDRFLAADASALDRRRQTRSAYQLREVLASSFMRRVQEVLTADELDVLAGRIAARETDPYAAASGVMARVCAPADRTEGSEQPRLDHIGVAVSDLDAAVSFYRDALGLEASPVTDVPTEHVRATFLPVGEASVELLESTGPASAIAKSIDRRGPGVHHLTLMVHDLRATLDRLKARGVRLVDEQPRPGAHGSLVAFIHPSAAQGVLIELKQRSDH